VEHQTSLPPVFVRFSVPEIHAQRGMFLSDVGFDNIQSDKVDMKTVARVSRMIQKIEVYRATKI